MAAEAKQKVDWRKEPPGNAFEMSGPEESYEPTMWPASDNYNRDRLRMASAMDCDYIEVRMETFWMVWAPVEAEERFRLEYRCTCENEDHLPCKTVEECTTAEPVTDLWDFWDEAGWFCPWKRCPASTPGAVKFRCGHFRPPSQNPGGGE